MDIIGCITGIISLVALIFMIGFWRGGVDSDRKYFHDCIAKYPPAEMHTMIKTLWDVYVLDALHARPDLASHGSYFKLKQETVDMIPDNIKTMLDNIPQRLRNREDIVTGFLAVSHLGIPTIEALAKMKKLSVQETIAILSCYLQSKTSAPEEGESS